VDRTSLGSYSLVGFGINCVEPLCSATIVLVIKQSSLILMMSFMFFLKETKYYIKISYLHTYGLSFFSGFIFLITVMYVIFVSDYLSR
jgi:hypothetical protein